MLCVSGLAVKNRAFLLWLHCCSILVNVRIIKLSIQEMAKGDPSQISVVLRDCTLYFSDDEDSEDWQKMLPTDQNMEIEDLHEHPGPSDAKPEIVTKTDGEEECNMEDVLIIGGQGVRCRPRPSSGPGALNGIKEEEGPDVQELHEVLLVVADGNERSRSSPRPCNPDGASKIPPGKSMQCKNIGTNIVNPTVHKPLNCTPCKDSIEVEENSTPLQRNLSADRKLTLETLTLRKRTYLCDNCGITSTQPLMTLPIFHQPEELSSCPNCGSKSFQMQLAFENQAADVVWNQHSCSECEMSFQNEDDLLKHQALHLDNPCWCTECGGSFRSQQGLKIHHNLVHTDNQTLMCNDCGKCFKEHCDLLEHRKMHRKKKWKLRTPLLKLKSDCKDSYVCTVCHQSFGCASTLLTHESSHTEERSFTCTECGESFFQKSHLVHHQKKHRQHQCLYCEEVITRHGYCGRHQNLLTGKRPQCTLCGKTFSKIFSLRRHEIDQHSGNKAHKCTECGKEFKDKYAFIMHQGIHLGDGPFKCTQCDTSFCLKSAFLEHMFGHTSEHLYTCVVCKKSFNNLAKLYEHQRLHTGEKPYTCNLCHKTFRRKSYVSIHFKSKHTGQGSLLQVRETSVDPSL